jgi:filamentous hemagglutinin
MGIEPQYTPYATAVAGLGDYAFNSLPPVAFLNGVGAMANAQSPLGFAAGVAIAATGVMPGLDELSAAAGAADRAGLSAAGRSLQKHSGREGSAFSAVRGNSSLFNRQGQNIVDDILTNPKSTTSSRYHARYGDVTEVRGPDGRGVRYDSDGKFLGFLEPPQK